METFNKSSESKFENLMTKCRELAEEKIGKVDPSLVEKLESFVREEINKMKNNVEFSLEKNDELHQKIISLNQNNDWKSREDSINKITTKISDQESGLRTTLDRIDELQNKINRASSDLQTMATKSSVWDGKVDSSEMEKIKNEFKGEIRDVKERLKAEMEEKSKSKEASSAISTSVETKLKENIKDIKKEIESIQTIPDIF